MFRHLLLAIVLGVSFQLSGLAASLGEAACAVDCPDDRSGGECPPNCHSCDCCSVHRTVTPQQSASAPLPEIGASDWNALPRTPPSVDPAEILHVPRLLA